jgi:putative PIN family toxin of toxin-antitoxin system
MRVTADTNFLISATQWDYSVAHKLLKRFILSGTVIFTTQEILDETKEVLKRDFKYDRREANNIINKILFFTKLIEPKQKSNIIKDDPDDNKVIDCAVESSSLYIITYDKHLLKLKEYEKIKIVTPEEVLNKITISD